MTEKALNAYRASLYAVNSKDKYLFWTRRSGLPLTITRHA